MHSQIHSQARPTESLIRPLPSLNRLWVLALILLAFALRLFRLGSESFWYDETVSAYLAAQPLPELIAHTARDIHPPAYYLLLHAWRLVSQPTVAFGLEYLYSWPNVALAILILALTFAVAKRSFGSAAAHWALAIAALHPFQIWFAQEVRMYALGALCVMLTLWACSPLLLDSPDQQSSPLLPRRMALLYVAAALLGLYTLYYFLFWLVVLNLCVLVRIRRHIPYLRTWLLLQLMILLGWLPWLPTFLRQAITPPVPEWRIPWQNPAAFMESLNEGIAALWVAHIPPLTVTWPWALVVVVTTVIFVVYTKNLIPSTRFIWLLLCIGPLVLLLGVSLIGPPIYHVRYLATYAPIFALLLGALLANIQRWRAISGFLLLCLISGLSLYELWTNPLYAADDHRNAVATLAREWRPGDLILVNAGWVYTALSVYWPTELPTPDASRPPAIVAMLRLDDIGSDMALDPDSGPIVVRTGSVNGPATLGWGLPESDFFSISAPATTEAMSTLAANATRIWHYRLYDTVSDPTALIRTWLHEYTTQESSQPFPGPGYLLLENFRTEHPPSIPEPTATLASYPDTALRLVALSYAPSLPAGEMLYVTLTWQDETQSPRAQTPALSLRLYDAQGQLQVQSDTPVTINLSALSTQQLALPIRADTIPGDYLLSLVVYAPDTLAPYPANAADGTSLPLPTPLGSVTVGPANR
jgi:uncharacterized membrane protein